MAQYSAEEIDELRDGGRILAAALEEVVQAVKPGITTLALDAIAREVIWQAGALPAFPGYQIDQSTPSFPAALCTSIDNEIVHGIPRSDRNLREGEIIGLDLGVKYKNLFTDGAVSVGVGRISKKSQKLIEATRAALSAGIDQVRPGNTVGDIGHAIQKVAQKHGFGIIRDLVGHGVGHAIHEPPYVPNYGRPQTLEKLVPGMVIAIEPMFTTGAFKIRLLDDGWTIVTADGSLAAHFEHTVAVTKTGNQVLTVS